MTSETIDRAEEARKQLLGYVEKHEMRVLLDQNHHRHLRFQTPGSSIGWFDLLTWPGRLVIAGDLDDFMFARTTDMFEFFAHDGLHRINPHYWGEKLKAPKGRESVKTYDPDRFRQLVREWHDGHAEGVLPHHRDEFRVAVHEQILCDEDVDHSEDAARIALRNFAWKGHTIDDWYEWRLRDWDHGYLLSCWAIVWGIARYREHQANQPAPDPDAFPDELTACRPMPGHDLEVVDWPPPDDSRAYARYVRHDLAACSEGDNDA